MKKESSAFIKGAAILGIASIIVKILGAIFRIPLANIIGDDGMGYYQTAYPVYNFILVVSTAGIPTAIAKIISEKIAIGDVLGADKVFKTTFKLMASVGLFMSILLVLTSKSLVGFLNNDKAFYSLIMIAPAILFVSMMAVYRGYFQGIQRMQAFATSQVVEQLGRVILGLFLAVILLKYGPEFSSAGATFGATAGSFCGFLILIYMYAKSKKTVKLQSFGEHRTETTSEVIKNLLMVAVPITIGASIMPVMSIFDLAIVLRRLVAIGYDPIVANELYGQLTGFANTLVNLPQTITAAIQISLVPAIAHFAILGDKENRDHTIETGMRIGLIIGLSAAVGLSVLSVDIMKLLYPMQMDIAENTGSILFILGFGIVFLSMFQVSTGILQGIGQQKLPARNLIISAGFKMVLSYVLVGIPFLNVRGAALSTVIAFAVAAILNHMSLVKHTKMHIDYNKIFVKPIIDVIVMAIVVKVSHVGLMMILPGSLATALAIVIGMVVFAFMLFATNTITDDDLDLMPGGGKIRRLKRVFKRS